MMVEGGTVPSLAVLSAECGFLLSPLRSWLGEEEWEGETGLGETGRERERFRAKEGGGSRYLYYRSVACDRMMRSNASSQLVVVNGSCGR